ncbi:MAG: ABC transporter ATP-binding protein [Cyanobacteria bacterium RM1_2_2]|nr:ABC transporter ATP-binding protein [Cyanobacteria bacterium RM1_2_2]
MVNYLSKILYVLPGSKVGLVWLLLLFVFTSVLEALGIGLIGPFLAIASNPESIERNRWLSLIYSYLNLQSTAQFIPILGLIISIIFVVKSTLNFFAKTYVIKYSFDQKGQLCLKLLNAYLSVPYTFHLSRNTSGLIKNIIVETNKFCTACLVPLLNAVANLVVMSVLLALLFRTSPLFLGLILAILLPVFLVFNKLGGLFRRWGQQSSDSQKEIIRIINHALGGIKETHVIGCEPYFEKQMEKQIHLLEKSKTLFHASQLLPRMTIETLLVISIVAFVCLFSMSQSEQEITSVLGVFAIASVRLIPTASQLIQGLGQMQNSAYAVDMLYLDLKELEKVEEANNSTRRRIGSEKRKFGDSESRDRLMPFNDQIDLKQITYSYPHVPSPAVDGVCLTLKKGQSVALIGRSGAGKTTLVDIILGLLRPDQGDICVDGVSIYDDLRSWQNLVGYIPQSIFLTDDTIERNIAFGVPDHSVDPEKLNQAIKAAQLEELINQLPDGIRTPVGERGVRLSGGQRQRIGIARALYHGREILVLDEATSALDNETEGLVTESIQSLSGQKTMIIIAHRLSTIEHCDCVYMMDKGRVVKSGSYEEVVLAS